MKTPSLQQATGFSLIEVLVAILVSAIGLLGVAALQTSALKNNQSALQRSQATTLAYSMMDAMRANRSAAIIGQYDLSKTCSSLDPGSTLVGNEKKAWLDTLKNNLGDTSATCGEVSCTIETCSVKVYWDDSRAVGGGNSQVAQIVSRL